MKCCVLTDVGTWTNWLTFEPDPDYSPDAGTGLLSPISNALQRWILLRRENPVYRYWTPVAAARRGFKMVLSTANRGNTFVAGTCALSPRLLAEPWRLEGRCVRAGRNESQRCLSLAVSPVYSTRTNMHFDTTFVHSTTMSPLYRVPAVFAPRDSEPARRGDRLLSHVEMSGTKL